MTERGAASAATRELTMTMRVLVVDDDESGRYLIASLMTGYGYEVVQAVDGRDALSKARAEPVDVVITDILMPNMDGYQLCREWKSDPVLSKAPLIFYSATYTDPADMRFADGLGADAFFVKPQEPSVLVAKIEEVVREHAEKNLPGREPSMTEETEVLREYNERLVSKLEHKLVELKRSNRDLTQALEALSDEVEVKKTLIEQLTQDVRVREQAQDDLSEATELLSALIASAPLGVVALDLDYTVRLWNPGAERLLGWTEEEVLGKPYPPAAGRAEEFDHLYGPLRSGDRTMMETQVSRTHRDGSNVDMCSYTAPLHGPDGVVRGFVSLFTDVTEQRHIEMVKTAFLSMVSHELRTPLTAIIGYTDVLEQVDLERDPSLFPEIVGKIRDHGHRMRELIETLLDTSQIEAGPLRVDLAPTDVTSLLRVEVDRIEVDPMHTLVFEPELGLPELLLDASRLRLVIRHLLGNAVKYSPAGGEVRVEATREDGWVRVSIKDRGIGIVAADAEHIFNSFTQADMSDTRSFGGIGVGLFLARQIVEAHRGRIELDSTPGEGSTFSIMLPAPD
jgi:PAS domain S-box-containing protein